MVAVRRSFLDPPWSAGLHFRFGAKFGPNLLYVKPLGELQIAGMRQRCAVGSSSNHILAVLGHGVLDSNGTEMTDILTIGQSVFPQPAARATLASPQAAVAASCIHVARHAVADGLYTRGGPFDHLKNCIVK